MAWRAETKFALLFALLAALAICLLSQASAFEARPTGVKDGDTYVISVRASGIDTPESAQLCRDAQGRCYACGALATQALQELIAGSKTLTFEVRTTGKYGRPVATVYRDSKDLHLAMLDLGWAVAYRRYLPDALKTAYIEAEDRAREAKRGMWQGEFVMPWDWRKGKRIC